MKKAIIFLGIILVMLVSLVSCGELACSAGFHDAEDEWLKIEPTCSSVGYEYRLCSRCGVFAEKRNTVPSTNTHVSGDTQVIFSEPTCSTVGIQAKLCKYCNQPVEEEEIPMLPHTPSEEWTVTVKESCDTDGERVQKCTVCSETIQSETISAHHTLVTLNGKAATCTSTGLTQGSACQVCGFVYTKQETIPVKSHNYKKVAAVSPTCSQYGYSEGYQCTSCSKWETERKRIDKTSHTVVNDPAVAATCTQSGKTAGSHCSVCKQSIVAQKTTNKLGHDYSIFNNTCTRCTSKEYKEIKSKNEANDWANNDRNSNIVVYLDYVVTVSDTNVYWTFTLDSNAEYIRFIGTAGVVYNVRIIVDKNRTKPVKIDLVNATIQTLVQSPIIQSEAKVDVEVGFYGTQCGIIGRNGDNGANGTASSRNGKNGGTGNIAIKTNGNLTITIATNSAKITGGNGGNGGNGGKMFGNDGGNGGNGGNGAYAISANTITLKCKSGYSRNNLSVSGGKGGNGGSGGEGSGFLYSDGSGGTTGSNSSATNVPIQ